MNLKEKIYKVSFINQGKIYDIFAKGVHQSGLLGFIEVEEIVFGEKSSVVVDPSEESLKTEFSGVSRTYIPMHSIVRIDEVEKMGQSKVSKAEGGTGTVTPFPIITSNHETGNS